MQRGKNSSVFAALHNMQTWSSYENSVRPSVHLSVRLSNACIVTKRKKDLSRFLYHTKDHLAYSFLRRMVGRGDPKNKTEPKYSNVISFPSLPCVSACILLSARDQCSYTTFSTVACLSPTVNTPPLFYLYNPWHMIKSDGQLKKVLIVLIIIVIIVKKT